VNPILSRRELFTIRFHFSAIGPALAGRSRHGRRRAPALSMPRGCRILSKADRTQRRSPLVLGYFPSWSKTGPAQLDFSLFTHLCHAFVSWVGGPLRFPERRRHERSYVWRTPGKYVFCSRSRRG